jgi:Family of unknown function (DUF6279)
MITRSNAMLRSLFRTAIIGLLLGALAGCSALKIAYGQAPTLAHWWIDGYLDLDGAQSDKTRAALQEMFRWHRATQLVDLADLLAKAQRQVTAAATPAQVCGWADELTLRLNVAYEHAIPAMAEVALTLKPAQLRHLERRYDKANEEFKDDFLQPSAAERQRASLKRAVERAEFIYGDLEPAQREVIARGIAASPFDPQAWLAERRARQADVLANLRRWTTERTSPEAVRAGLRQLGERTQRSARDGYRSYQQRLLDYNCAFAADIHNATTPAQRQHAAKKLKAWEDDLRALSADTAP